MKRQLGDHVMNCHIGPLAFSQADVDAILGLVLIAAFVLVVSAVCVILEKVMQ